MDPNSFAFCRFAVPIGILLVLAACGQRIGSAPVVYGAAGKRLGNTTAQVKLPATVSVRRGDTLYKISRRYNLRLRAIIDANNLKPPYTIFRGQKLRMPVTSVHMVARGETIYQIARRYGAEPGTLVRLNRISPPYRLFRGQRLLLPAGAFGDRRVASVRRSAPTITSAPVRELNHSYISKPAARSGVSSSVTRPVGIPSPRKVLPAERVVGKRRPATSATERGLPQNTSGFIWPVSGILLSKFGTLGKGLQNDGINIEARRGTPVRSIQNGVVAYSGNELRGFGNLLLVKHGGGWISAYAHNEKLLVRTGQRVRRGQVISHVGSTGSVDRPQLHFELRRQNHAVNPERYLGRRTARLTR